MLGYCYSPGFKCRLLSGVVIDSFIAGVLVSLCMCVYVPWEMKF